MDVSILFNFFLSFIIHFAKSHLVENIKIKFENNHMVQQYLNKLGHNIQNIRKAKKLSQEKLAELAGRSRNYIGMIERAEVNVPAKTLLEIAKVLNVHPKRFWEF